LRYDSSRFNPWRDDFNPLRFAGGGFLLSRQAHSSVSVSGERSLAHRVDLPEAGDDPIIETRYPEKPA